MSNKRVWLALVLPLLAISVAIARAELFLRRAQEVSLPIQGYDPRDLLHGHYIQFQLAVQTTQNAEQCARAACCLCLTNTHAQQASTQVLSCTQAHAQCAAALPLQAAQRSWRFYVAEAQAREIERALRDAHAVGRAFAVLAVQPSGEARVRELRLDGQRYSSP